MSVSREHYDYCKRCLYEREDFAPVEVQRFLDNAYRESYRKCPYCGGEHVYSCSQKQIVSSGGQRFMMGLFTYGASAFIGNGNKFYWCPDCSHSGGGWY